MIVEIITALIIGVTLHFSSTLLSRQVDRLDAWNTVASYLVTILILVLNLLKYFIAFFICWKVINLFWHIG